MWHILGYSSKNSIFLRDNTNEPYSISRLGDGSVISLYLFDLDLNDKQVRRIERELKDAKEVYITFSIVRHFSHVTRFAKTLKNQKLNQTQLSEDEEKNFNDRFVNLASSFDRSEIILQSYVLINEEDKMESTISGLWRLGFLQRPLMHLWLIANDANNNKDTIDELCHRTGYHKEVVKFLTDVFEQAGVLSTIGGSFVFAQQAKQIVGEYIKNDYGYDEKPKIKISLRGSSGDILTLKSPKEFLDASYGKNKKDFALYVCGLFKAYMSNVSISEPVSDGNNFKFTISMPNKWTADFYCYPGYRTITKADLGIALFDANLNSINIISGHHFSAEVVKGAKGRVVHLIDPFSMLRWHNFLGSLSENELIAYTEHFPDTFDKKGGYVSIGLATNTLRAIIKNK